MPKAKNKARATKPAGRHATRAARRVDVGNVQLAEPEVLQLLQPDNVDDSGSLGNGNINGTNTIDFEKCFRESGLAKVLEAQRGCGGCQIVSEGSNLDLASGIEPMHVHDDEVYVHVPMFLREQIWRGEFINLALLLKGSIELKEMCMPNTLRVTSMGYLEATPKVCKENLENIANWTDAFLVYIAICVVKTPNTSPEYIRYMTVIREAARMHKEYGWRNYNTQFRLCQAMHTAPWNTTNQDLWRRCMFPLQEQRNGNNYNRVSRPYMSAAQSSSGTCHDFNNGLRTWVDCVFLHTCDKCGQKHAKVDCPSNRNPGQGVNRQSYASRGAFRGSNSHSSRGRGFFKNFWGNYGRGYNK